MDTSSWVMTAWFEVEYKLFDTSSIRTSFTLTYIRHKSEYSITLEKSRKLLSSRMYPICISSQSTATILFAREKMLIAGPWKGDTLDLAPGMYSRIRTFFLAHDVSVWVSIPNLHPYSNSVLDRLWLDGAFRLEIFYVLNYIGSSWVVSAVAYLSIFK